ncbi:MAG: hypothetical protein AABY32_05090 [Nanoarchaeota archaeon]
MKKRKYTKRSKFWNKKRKYIRKNKIENIKPKRKYTKRNKEVLEVKQKRKYTKKSKFWQKKRKYTRKQKDVKKIDGRTMRKYRNQAEKMREKLFADGEFYNNILDDGTPILEKIEELAWQDESHILENILRLASAILAKTRKEKGESV